jgi:peroxiredoxin family protein
MKGTKNMTMKRRLKNAEEKRMDGDNLAKRIEGVVKAAQAFHDSMWGCEMDIEYIGFKTVLDVVNSVDPVSSARSRLSEKYVAFDCDDLNAETTWHKFYEKEEK